MNDNILGSGASKSASARPAVEDLNTLRSKSYANVLDLLGEGEWEEFSNGKPINPSRVYLDEVPIADSTGKSNFQGVSLDVRSGSLSQSALPLKNSVSVFKSVNVLLTQGIPITQNIVAADADILRVSVTVPKLTTIDTSTGDVHGSSVNYKIEYNSADNTAWREVAGDGAYRYEEVNQTLAASYTGFSTYYISAASTPPSYKPPDFYAPRYTLPYTITYQKSVNGGAWTNIQIPVIPKPTDLVRGVIPVQANTTDTISFRVVFADTSGHPNSYWPNYVAGEAHMYSVIGARNVYFGNFTLAGKTTTPYEQQIDFRPTGISPFNVRVTRLSPDSVTETVQNSIVYTSLSAVLEEKFRYPGSVVASIQVDASQFNTIPTRAYKCKMLKIKIPNNYNPITRQYTGLWDGGFATELQWTDNPAWCFYDLVTNTRYGLGDRIPESYVDKYALYKIAQYCDGWNPETGLLDFIPDGSNAYEPRFTCNLYIQTQQEAYKVISDMASIFRGMAYWGAGSVVAVQDCPKEPVYAFNNTNVVEGNFQYQSSDVNTRYNAISVTWNDPDNFYRQAVEYIEDKAIIARDGFINHTSVVAFGCTSSSMARRVGKWALYSNTYETDVVSFTVGADGALPRPGDVVSISDTLRATERRGGRVKSATTVNVVIDTPMAFTGGVNYTISTISVTGKLQDALFLYSGTTDTLSLSTAFAEEVAADSIFIITDASIPESLFRVLAIVEKEGKYEITALSYNPSKYNYVEKRETLVKYPVVDKVVYPVVNLVAQEVLYLVGRSYKSKILATWSAPKFASKYEVVIKALDGRIYTDITTSPYYELNDVSLTTYTVSVKAINYVGMTSSENVQSVVIVGKTTNPSNVTTASYAIEEAAGVIIKWASIADGDVAGYEIRKTDIGWGTESGKLFRGDATQALFVPNLGTETYYIKAYDDRGHYSTTAKTVIVTLAVPSVPTGLSNAFADTSTTASTVTFKWVAPVSQFLITGYRVTLTAPAGLWTRTVIVNTNEWVTQANWLGDATLSVVAINLFGWESAVTSQTVSKYPPGSVSDFRAQVIDNNVLLYWTLPNKTTLPIDHVKFRKGASWAGGEDIGTKSGSFTTIFETKPATYTYWAVVVDTDSNEGAPVSISARVDEPPDYILQGEKFSTFGATKVNAINEFGVVLLPVNTTETWQGHFTSHSWTTPQDQVTAGYPVYVEPTMSTGYYEETFDFVSVFQGTKVTVNAVGSTILGSAASTINIELSPNGSTWTSYPNTTIIYGTNFRYVRVRVTITTPNTGLDLYRLTALQVKLETKTKDDAGTVSCLSTDANGTIFNFNKSFVDVGGITLTPSGTTPVVAIYDYLDSNLSGTYSITSNVCTVNTTGHGLIAGQQVALNFTTGTAVSGVYTVASVTNANTYTVGIVTPNTSGNIQTYPQGARAYLFNLSGTRVSGSATWSVRGN